MISIIQTCRIMISIMTSIFLHICAGQLNEILY